MSSISLYLLLNYDYKLLTELDLIKGVWHVTVKNNGNKMCTAVNLKLPGAIYGSTSREGQASVETKLDEIVRLENLQPQEEISLVAWTVFPIYSRNSEKIRLTHSEGIGKINFYTPVEPFWSWIAENWIIILWMISMVVLLLVLIYQGFSKRPINQDDAVEISAEERSDTQ